MLEKDDDYDNERATSISENVDITLRKWQQEYLAGVSRNTRLGQWLSNLPLVSVAGDTLFVVEFSSFVSFYLESILQKQKNKYLVLHTEVSRCTPYYECIHP